MLSKALSLQMPAGLGSNASAVVWHPVLKKYYTSMVGNADYPMAIFDATGKKTSDSIVAGFDFRGMWYNTVSKRIEFNCYNDAGWGHLILDVKGNIKDKSIDFAGLNQPNEQCVGVYATPDNKVIFYNTETHKIQKYNASNAAYNSDVIKLYPGCSTAEEVETMLDEDLDQDDRWEERNTNVQYFGKTGQEFALLNAYNLTIELYDQKTGLMTDSFQLPEGAITNYSFNFSYSNNIWWLFNKDERKWVGYKYNAVPAAKK